MSPWHFDVGHTPAVKRLPERLAELRKQVEEYTDLELAALARRVRAQKSIAVARVQSAQERLQKTEEERKKSAEAQAVAALKKRTPMRARRDHPSRVPSPPP